MDIQPDLIHKCLKSDRKAEYELYRLCYGYLMSICVRYTHQEGKAKEVLNLGFYKILKNLDKYNTASAFKPWARKVMINTLINEFKKQKIHYGNMVYVENYYDDDNYTEMNEAITKSNAREIYDFIAKLPPASQQVFNLYFVDGYKHREIAELLSISEGTSKWHLNNAKELLKQMLLEVKIENT
jgi:RNA polymerase sigma-70 factor (ECF subfamily)